MFKKVSSTKTFGENTLKVQHTLYDSIYLTSLKFQKCGKWSQKIKYRKPNKAKHTGIHYTSQQETQNLKSRLNYLRTCLKIQKNLEVEN